MKKNVLALSIATMIGGLGFVGSATADVVVGAAPLTATNATQLQFAEGGIGHALLFPYYNAQNGNMSVFHVVNTDTSNGKALKVRFRGALNSDDVLDFQVYMSPGDVWTAAVTAGADGVAQIVTEDASCTLPRLSKGVPQSFVLDRLQGASSPADKPNNTREGYVEIFNMADVPPTIPGTATANPLFTAIKHVNGVAPCTDGVLNGTLANYTTPAAAAAGGFDTPSTGLLGDYYIINVAQTTTYSGGATAIRALTGAAGTAGANARGNFVHFPQNANSAANVNDSTADPLFRTANKVDGANVASVALQIAAANYDLPDMSTPYFTPPSATAPLVQARELTDALAVFSVVNQYANDPVINAKTDWVFSMPTRRYNVAANYAAASTAGADFRQFSVFPTNNRFTPGNTAVVEGAICVNSDGTTFYDREETSKVSGAVFSPGTAVKTRFCGETSVLSFADSGVSVLGASVARQNVAGVYVNGWANVNTTNNVGGTALGLPILGSSFQKLTNPQATQGNSGTYGISWPHRFTRFQ